MPGPSPELAKLIEYLNAPSHKLRALAPLYRQRFRSITFEKLDPKGHLQKLKKQQEQFRNNLCELVAPEALLPWKTTGEAREARQFFKTNIIDKYLTPINRLESIVQFVNSLSSKPEWRLVAGSDGNIKMGRSSFFVRGGGDALWLMLARLLETGEIQRLGCCLVCQKFFAKKRQKQICCNPKTCGKAYDNRKRVELKIEARRQKREAKHRKNVEEEKAHYRKIFADPNFTRYFPGAPAQRYKERDKLLKKLDAAPSVDDFKRKDLGLNLRRILSTKFNLV